ncbi:MAG TPA: response regulator [Kangiella sp.]
MATKKYKALIVDDSRTAYMVLARMLANYKIEAVHANSGDQALTYLKDHSVDVIFLDQAMPGKDGIETIKEIKSSSNADTPVMMFTARSGDEYLQAVKELGAEGVLPKELSVDEVEEALIQLKLWSPVTDVAPSDNVAGEVLHPSSDEKLKVWLESFLENQFSPQLSNKVRKATDDLRRDTIHYGKRMLDEIAKTDKQQQMIKEVKGQTDYLKQLFANSFKQYRLISNIFIVMLIILTSGIFWLAYQISALSSEQKALKQQLITLTEDSKLTEQRLIQEVQHQSVAVERFLEQERNQQSQSPSEAYALYHNKGKAGEVIGMEKAGSLLTTRSENDYLFVVDVEGKVADSDLKRYYIQANCSGPVYVNAMPGLVLRVNNETLGYTEINSEGLVHKPTSWMDTVDHCHEYQSDSDMLVRELLKNDEAITGVSDTFYFQ